MRKTFAEIRALLTMAVVLLGAISIGPELAQASTTTSSMPYSTATSSIKDDLTGPTASAIGITAFAVLGGVLAFGGEISGFVKGLIYTGMAVSLMPGAATLYQSWFASASVF